PTSDRTWPGPDESLETREPCGVHRVESKIDHVVVVRLRPRAPRYDLPQQLRLEPFDGRRVRCTDAPADDSHAMIVPYSILMSNAQPGSGAGGSHIFE